MLSRRMRYSFATIAWRIAAMHTASSTRVQTSQMRNSSVGYFQCGRTSHQIFEPSGMQPVTMSVSRYSSYALHDGRWRGTPERGNARKIVERYDLSPVLRPIQNGELVERQRMCGRK